MNRFDTRNFRTTARIYGITVEEMEADLGFKIGDYVSRPVKHRIEAYLAKIEATRERVIKPRESTSVAAAPTVVAPAAEAPTAAPHIEMRGRVTPSRVARSAARAGRRSYECRECGDYVAAGSTCWDTGLTH